MSYTVNDLGDAIGVVALAVLVFDRTQAVAPTAGFFLTAKFLPALFATGLMAHLDRLPLRRVLPSLYAAEAVVFGDRWRSWRMTTRFVLALVLLLGLSTERWPSPGAGSRAGAVAGAAAAREPDR